MKKTVWFGVLATGMAIGVAMAQEQPARGAGPGGRPAMGGGQERGLQMEWMLHNDAIIKEIGLTTQQVEKLKSLHLDSQKQMIDLDANVRRAALQETELLSQPSPDEAAVMKAVEETGKAQVEVAKVRVKTLLKMLAVLTPVQHDKVKEIFKRRMAERANRSGMGMRRGGRDGGANPPNPPPNAPAPAE